MSASQRVANAHTPSSWETSRVKISVGWKNTYGCCRNEYDLWQVICVCLKRAAHFKKMEPYMICVIWDNSTIKFFFSYQIGRGFRDTPGNSKPSVRFCLQVESKENCNSDNCLKGSLNHSVLLAEGLTPINSSGSPQKMYFMCELMFLTQGAWTTSILLKHNKYPTRCCIHL